MWQPSQREAWQEVSRELLRFARKGMPEWKNLRESDLAELVAAEPPAISPMHIGNGYVWTLALLPLVFGVIEAAVSATNQEAAARSLALGFPYHPSKGLPFQ